MPEKLVWHCLFCICKCSYHCLFYKTKSSELFLTKFNHIQEKQVSSHNSVSVHLSVCGLCSDLTKNSQRVNNCFLQKPRTDLYTHTYTQPCLLCCSPQKYSSAQPKIHKLYSSLEIPNFSHEGGPEVTI